MQRPKNGRNERERECEESALERETGELCDKICNRSSASGRACRSRDCSAAFGAKVVWR